MGIPFEDNSFDAVYAIEATCHAPRREDVFGEIYRVLKPGQTFACYEWGVTDKYREDDPVHKQMGEDVMKGDGLPGLANVNDIRQALANVGFEVIEARDLAHDPQQVKTWYHPLTPSWNPLDFRFQLNWLGRTLINSMLFVMEMLWLAPRGTMEVNRMLYVAARGLVQGGKDDTFTPMYLLVGRKPAA